MCQEPTELLWIGCLTELILILKIQIRYIDTKHQLSDILTASNFTRGEWDDLLHLFNISHFSSTCCAKGSSLISCPWKDGEEDARTEEAKSKFTAMNLSSHVPWRGSDWETCIAKQLKGTLEHPADQKTWEIPELKENNGHTIHTFLQIPCLAWKQSSRSSDKSTNERPRTQWRTWTWTRLFGAYFWIPLFKQWFMLVNAMRCIYDSWKIISGSL